MKSLFTLLSLTALMTLATASAGADPDADRAQLEALLLNFLGTTEKKETHEAFWAPDLIYTSSAGERFGKDAILAGFDDASSDDVMSMRYGAEDITIRVLGDLAVITFRLTADRDGERDSEYFNSGVFRRDAGSWQAFTWQATRIPPSP